MGPLSLPGKCAHDRCNQLPLQLLFGSGGRDALPETHLLSREGAMKLQAVAFTSSCLAFSLSNSLSGIMKHYSLKTPFLLFSEGAGEHPAMHPLPATCRSIQQEIPASGCSGMELLRPRTIIYVCRAGY